MNPRADVGDLIDLKLLLLLMMIAMIMMMMMMLMMTTYGNQLGMLRQPCFPMIVWDGWRLQNLPAACKSLGAQVYRLGIPHTCHIYKNMYIYMCIYIYIYVTICILYYIHAYMHTYIHTYIHIHILDVRCMLL